MNKIFSWGIVLFSICIIVYLVSDILAPFIISFIIAYILQPAINAYSKKFTSSRSKATIGVFSLFLSGFIIIIVIVAPIIYDQFSLLIHKIPQYNQSMDKIIDSWSNQLHSIDPEIATKISDSAQSVVNNILALFSSFANHIWHYTLATINFFTIIALVPIILFYFLRDWPKMVKSIEYLLPVKGKSKTREIVYSVHELLSAYIRGPLNICMILTCYYAMGLSIIGIDLALLLGIFSGFLIIIPFIGTLISFLLVLTSCYFSFGAHSELVYVIILFVIGHIIESYILTPKIIGNKIGLHPLWIMFSLFAAANLFGIAGIFFALPAAGIIKVCFSHLVDYYRSSELYRN
ncbi:MAG: AI-2E family transporter [Rickettsiales bacterium]|nr:MAG: AI-2E family transporter [Rickettsiales bacterium]